MTPKEKAIELVNKFIFIPNGERFQIISIADEKRAIQCALIAVDLIIYHTEQDSSNIPLYEIYLDVKKEIEKL